MVEKSNDQFINYIYLRCSRNFLTQISMNIPVISSNKVYRTQPEKNMHEVLLKVNSKVYRYKIKIFLLTVHNPMMMDVYVKKMICFIMRDVYVNQKSH